MSLYLGTTPIAVNSSSRNIGEIIQSTIPLTDAGLHLLDGSVISGSGSYSAFVTHIAGLVSGHSELFTTEADWQTAVATYGVCGKFVYDSVNNTVRLPKYSDKIYTSLDTAPVKGNGKSLGLTDGTNNAGLGVISANAVAARRPLFDVNVGTTTTATTTLSTLGAIGVITDSSKSGIIADLSNITTALDGYYYIVIATSTKTQIEVDIDEVMTDLNGKADVDLSNVSSSGKTHSIGWCIPDYNNPETISNLPFTAPHDCFAFVSVHRSANNSNPGYISINGTNFIRFANVQGYTNGSSTAQIALKQGDIVNVSGNAAFTQGYYCNFRGA